MKLSEAIRLGSLLKRQAFDYLFDADTSCAQGAALEACGVIYTRGFPTMYYHHKLKELWPWVSDSKDILCPEGDAPRETLGYIRSIAGVLGHLNNDHRWTRERIADWVETVEPRNIQDASAFTALHEHNTNSERTPS